VDVQDCLEVFIKTEIDPYALYMNYKETAGYDINPDKVMKNFILFAEKLYSKGFVSDDFLKKVMS